MPDRGGSPAIGQVCSTPTPTPTHIYIYIYIYVSMCMYVCMYVCMYIYIYIHICMIIYTSCCGSGSAAAVQLSQQPPSLFCHRFPAHDSGTISLPNFSLKQREGRGGETERCWRDGDGGKRKREGERRRGREGERERDGGLAGDMRTSTATPQRLEQPAVRVCNMRPHPLRGRDGPRPDVAAPCQERAARDNTHPMFRLV